MVGPRRVSPGDRVRKSASEHNAFVDAALWVQANTYNRGGGGRDYETDADWTWIKNNTGATRLSFECVELGDVTDVMLDSGGDLDGHRQMVIDGNTPSNNVRHTAVLQEPIQDGKVGKAWVSGVHPAEVNVVNILHRRATSTDASHILRSDMIGPYMVLNSLTATGQQTCIVKKSNRASIKLVGVTGSGGISAATWSSGGSGCDCYTLTPGSGTVTLLLWDAEDADYKRTTLTMTVYNIADAVAGCKGVSFSTDDDGCPTVDVEPCNVSCD